VVTGVSEEQTAVIWSRIVNTVQSPGYKLDNYANKMRRDFPLPQNVQTGTMAHLAFSREVNKTTMKLVTHLHLVPKSSM
jgi:hypothetical protein